MKFRFDLNLVKLVSVSTCFWLLGFVCCLFGLGNVNKIQ